MPEGIPIVMFGWLAANLIMGWHQGALLRVLVQQVRGEGAERRESRRAGLRVDAKEASPQVRVQTSDLGPDEVVAGTEVKTTGEGRRAGR